MNPKYVIPIAAVALAAGVFGYGAMSIWNQTPEERQKAYYDAHWAVPPKSELMSRAVTTCDQLAKEIEDMGQVTAEIRKVLRDMEYVTCASKMPLGSPMTIGPLGPDSPGPKPDCSPGEAVPYYGTWTCVSVPK